MKEVLDGIRANIGAENCCGSLSGDGCKVYLDDIPRDRIVVDAEKAFEAHGRSGKRCDFILFVPGDGRKLVAAPIELKSGGVDISEALEQLQGGAAFTERFAPKTSGAVCRPILFYGGSIHKSQLKALNRGKIRFHQVDFTVTIKRCGHRRNLADALKT